MAKIKQLVENNENFYPLTHAEGVVFGDGTYLTSKQFANNGTLTIKQGGSTVGTFSANSSTDVTVNLSGSDLSAVVASARYNSTSTPKKIEFLNSSGTVISYIDATDFIVDGMIDNVSIGTGTGANAGVSCLLIDFNTDAEGTNHTDIEIPLTQIFNPDNYYTKTVADSTFVNQTDYEDDSQVISAALNDLNGRLVTVEEADTGEDNVIETIKVNGTAQTVTNKAVDITVPTTLASLTDDSTHRLVTDTEKTKLQGIAAGAEVNVQSDWSVTDSTSDAYIANKPTIPTKVSDLTNDSGFTTNTGTITSVKMNGTTVSSSGEANLGTVITSHQDISGKANLASPTFTGTPAAPTAAAGTNTTQIATTAFVQTAVSKAASKGALNPSIFGEFSFSGSTFADIPLNNGTTVNATKDGLLSDGGTTILSSDIENYVSSTTYPIVKIAVTVQGTSSSDPGYTSEIIFTDFSTFVSDGLVATNAEYQIESNDVKVDNYYFRVVLDWNDTNVKLFLYKRNATTVTSTYSSTGTDAVNGTAVASALSSYVTNTEFNNDARVVSAALNDLNDRITDAEDAIDGLALGDTNVIETVKVNGTALTPDANKAVDINTIPMTETTWSVLKTLRDGGNLVPGMQYRITDYNCIVDPEFSEEYISGGHAFDIIVIADTTSKLNESARAAIHSGDSYFQYNNLSAWELKYRLDNDTDNFSWAYSSGKGIIYYMKDEWNNECPYDFKNIKFIAKEANSTVGIVANVAYYTFSDVSGANDQTVEDLSIYDAVCRDNKICAYCPGPFYLPGNIFRNQSTDCNSNEIGFDSWGNVFGFNAKYNKLGKNCSNNSFGSACYYNTLEDNCSDNIISNACVRNTFYEYCRSNSISNNSRDNVFYSNCSNNTLGTYCMDNIFGAESRNNILGNSCKYNNIGNYCSYITMGNVHVSNIFMNSVNHIKFGNSSAYQNNYDNIIVESGNQYIYLYCSSNTSSNHYRNVKIAQGVNTTTTWKTITDTNVGQTYQTVYQPTNSQTISV